MARPLLWRLDAERTHRAALAGLAAISRSELGCLTISRHYRVEDERLKVRAFGLEFDNPLMLAAGFDKNAEAIPGLLALGFSGVEVGTVTPLPQEGNPQPRIFRLTEDAALINRMGFPNHGAEAVWPNLRRFEQAPGIIGLNIGPNKHSVEQGYALGDYLALLHGLGQLGDYITINISSPNTKGLRQLQAKQPLTELLSSVAAYRDQYLPMKPILLKVAPDVIEQQLLDILEVLSDAGLNGIVATNTLMARPENLRSRHQTEVGGLSGIPLRHRSLEMVRRIYRETEGKLPIVAAGGVFTGDDAWDYIAVGASVVQTYTGFVYGGPSMPRTTLRRLVDILDQRDYDFGSISEVRGSSVHLS